MSKSFDSLQQHSINLEINLQQCQEKIYNDKSFKENQSKEFRKEREQYFEIQDLKAQLQDKAIAISELKKLIEKLKGKSMDTKFEKSSVNRQPNAFKSQRPSILGKPTIYSDSLERKDFSKSKISADLEKFHVCLKEEMVANLRYFNSLELEIDSLKSQLKTQKTQFLNEIDRISREYYYADHMNVILGVYTEFDEVTNLQCDYLQMLEKCECLEKELSKSKKMSKSFDSLQQHSINLEINLQQCQEKIYNDKSFKENQSKEFRKEREQYFEIQDLKAQLQDKAIAISELKKLIEKLKGKSMDTKFKKSSVNRQPNAFKSQRPSNLGKPTIYSDSLERKDFSKSKPVTKNNVSNDFSKPNDIMIGLPKLKFVKDHLCSSCELGKAKQKSFQTKTTLSSKRQLQLLHMDLCGPMRLASINGRKYVLVIVDDYSRYTWTHFLRFKDETPRVLIDFLMLVQRGLHAQVRIVQTDKGTKFLNKTLHAYFASEGILHQTSVAQTPEQNGVADRRNRTLIEAAQTMPRATKAPLFFWVEAITIACFTQNRSLVIPQHEKTPYHIINDRKPSVKFFHIFG
nr:retrovirus-related Pol polyprotein from transposon TNT 1-94 [Tanacetum cinerariifolium]